MGSRFRSEFRSNEATWLAHARRSKRSDRSPTARPDFPRSVIAAAPRLQGRRRGASFPLVVLDSRNSCTDGKPFCPYCARWKIRSSRMASMSRKGAIQPSKNGPTEDVAREKCRHGSNGDVSPVEFEWRYVQRGSGVSMERRGIRLQIGDRVDSRSSALRSSCAMGSSAPRGVRMPSIERLGVGRAIRPTECSCTSVERSGDHRW